MKHTRLVKIILHNLFFNFIYTAGVYGPFPLPWIRHCLNLPPFLHPKYKQNRPNRPMLYVKCATFFHYLAYFILLLSSAVWGYTKVKKKCYFYICLVSYQLINLFLWSFIFIYVNLYICIVFIFHVVLHFKTFLVYYRNWRMRVCAS